MREEKSKLMFGFQRTVSLDSYLRGKWAEEEHKKSLICGVIPTLRYKISGLVLKKIISFHMAVNISMTHLSSFISGLVTFFFPLT